MISGRWHDREAASGRALGAGSTWENKPKAEEDDPNERMACWVTLSTCCFASAMLPYVGVGAYATSAM